MLLNKFSIIMHDSFQKISDVDHLMIDKIELYAKLLNFIRKFNPQTTGLLLDSNKAVITNFRGSGYEMINPAEISTSFERDYYHIIFIYPNCNEIDKHSKNLIFLNNSEFEQRSKYHFDSVNFYFLKTKIFIFNIYFS